MLTGLRAEHRDPGSPLPSPRHRAPLREALLLVAALLLLLSSSGPSAAAEEGEIRGEAPPGATDGQPTGTWDDPPEGSGDASATPAGTDGASTSATTRYFGRGPFEAIKRNADAANPPCSITTKGLTAMAIAPVFRETSTATSRGAEPAPMTLSRSDEWTGVYPPPDTNLNTNYGLYAFRDPHTSYPRAYWHSGIGMWQYDSAGAGAPFTADERIDVDIIAADVIENMGKAYCAASGSDQDKRYAAWRPWGFPCTACQSEFDDMYPNFTNLVLSSDVTAKGGMQARKCRFGASGATFDCHYIDPARAEGANWWTARPNDGNPTSGMTPLSAPFYVFERNGHEERHWLRKDSGYPVSIWAKRQIGKNARPRSTPAGSGLQWATDSQLCDVSAGTGCSSADTAQVTLTNLTNRGSAVPLRGDFNRDGLQDLFWYAAGGAADDRWLSTGNGSFTKKSMPVSGTYQPFVGDFDGDGRDDIFWYARGPATDYIWWSGDNAQSVPVSVSGSYRPIIGNFDGTGGDDVFWYAPGRTLDYVWRWNQNRQHTSQQHQVVGTYMPLVGDFDGDKRSDIFWYAPGTAADSVWYGASNGFARGSANVNGSFIPLVGDFDWDNRSDIFWYAPGSPPDYTWFGRTDRSNWISVRNDVSGHYRPFVIDLDPSGVTGGDDIVWYAPGSTADYRWHGQPDRTFASSPAIDLRGNHVAIPGQFAGSDRGDMVLWDRTGGDDLLRWS